jgi:hypothetical protein
MVNRIVPKYFGTHALDVEKVIEDLAILKLKIKRL